MTATNRTEQLINTVLIPAICNLGGTVPPRPKVTNLEDYQFLLLQELVNHLVNTVNTVASVFGRSGNVVAQAGDYTAAQVGADPAGIAAAGDATHVAATDPHPQYATDSDLSAHTGAVAPHSGHATTTALTAHTGNTSNPHATTAAQVAALAIANNLSDLSSAATSRTNLSVPAIS
nr:hypothetical protein [Scytolyngbya sp. HA4215-MV1]